MTELDWPFLVVEALAAKMIPERAMRTLYEPIYPGVYAPWGIALTARQRACAAWLWSRRRGIVGGNSGAALLGSKWVSPELDAELVHVNRKPPPRLVVHTDTLKAGEVITVDGMAVTNPARTAFDIGRRTPSRVLAVARVDATGQCHRYRDNRRRGRHCRASGSAGLESAATKSCRWSTPARNRTKRAAPGWRSSTRACRARRPRSWCTTNTAGSWRESTWDIGN